MHADGYAGFEKLYRSGRVREVACMAHIQALAWWPGTDNYAINPNERF
jgi:hypothetical protein